MITRGTPNISRARTPYSGCSGNLNVGLRRQRHLQFRQEHSRHDGTLEKLQDTIAHWRPPRHMAWHIGIVTTTNCSAPCSLASKEDTAARSLSRAYKSAHADNAADVRYGPAILHARCSRRTMNRTLHSWEGFARLSNPRLTP